MPAWAQNWSAMGNGFNASVMTINSNSNGDTLFAGGRFVHSGGVIMNNIAYWTNGSWAQPATGLDNPVKTIVRIQDRIFAGGEFAYGGDSLLNCFAEWNGTRFTGYARGFFKSGQHSVATTVNAIAYYKNKIYAGGIFDYANDKTDYMRNIAAWNGSKWEDAGGGITGNSGVNCMLVFNDTLYVGGGFTTSGGTTTFNVSRWDGSAWRSVGNGMNNEVNCFVAYQGTLYAGGVFTQAGGNNISYIAKWDGTNWKAVGGGINGPVYALAVSGGQLIAGGSFTSAGGKICSNLAKWNGTEWFPYGTNNNMIRTFYQAPNAFYAGGDFTEMNGQGMNRIASIAIPSALQHIEADDFIVLPNPVSRILLINTPESISIKQITLIDAAGKTVYRGTASPLDVSDLHAGTYLLHIETEMGFYRKLVVVSHE